MLEQKIQCLHKHPIGRLLLADVVASGRLARLGHQQAEVAVTPTPMEKRYARYRELFHNSFYSWSTRGQNGDQSSASDDQSSTQDLEAPSEDPLEDLDRAPERLHSDPAEFRYAMGALHERCFQAQGSLPAQWFVQRQIAFLSELAAAAEDFQERFGAILTNYDEPIYTRQSKIIVVGGLDIPGRSFVAPSGGLGWFRRPDDKPQPAPDST